MTTVTLTRGTPMIRKLLMISIPAAVGAIVVMGWPDIRRYVAIKQMSRGQGRPENVPMRGTQAYPKHAGGGAQDGTGDFDSASRGGPATAL
jgi:hypothetical protein